MAIRLNREMLNYLHPVGEYYETSNLDFNPNDEWGGKWNLENDGTVLVSRNTSSGSKFNQNIGTVVGAETHTLNQSEMPSHSHGTMCPDGLTGTWAATWTECGFTYPYARTNDVGGNQPHNNVQPSKIVNRWHRIA